METGERDWDNELARCRGCHGALRHTIVYVFIDAGEGEMFRQIVPSWHKECIPVELQSGSRWFKQ